MNIVERERMDPPKQNKLHTNKQIAFAPEKILESKRAFRISCPDMYIVFFLFLCSLCASPIKVPNVWSRDSEVKRVLSGHYPFISYLTFRNICDHAIDEATMEFDPEKVQYGDLVYLKEEYLGWFVDSVHDLIEFPYILVSGDMRAWSPPPWFQKLLYDPKLTAWFSRNMVFSYHPKLFQIPMGQDLALFNPENPKAALGLLEAVMNKPVEKTHLAYMNHYPREHGDRELVIQLFEKEPYVFSRNQSQTQYGPINRAQYYQEMASSKFVFSPLGYETDSVRTWEALVLDCIPILEHTFLDPSYERLPVALVHDWKQVNPKFLEEQYEKLHKRKTDEAYFDYWLRLLKGYQKKVRSGDLSHAQLELTQFESSDLRDFLAVLEETDGYLYPFFYKGFFCALRPFQVAGSILSKINLFDPYIDRGHFANLGAFVTDRSLLKHQNRIELFEREMEFLRKAFNNGPCCFFLDLTYYRTSLFVSFIHAVVKDGNFRHSLKRDLKTLFDKLANRSILFGNMATNEYVSEVLTLFSQEYNIQIKTCGSFWYVVKLIP